MIRIETHLADSPLTGQSKWWGEPDMPEELNWPTVMVRDEDGESYDDPLTFVCQIRCADIAPFDPHELLPHEGMLYFFAAIDYFLGDFDTPLQPDFASVDTASGNTLLLCSDGLCGYCTDEQIAQTLQDSRNNTAACADGLVQLALDADGQDNICVAVATVLSNDDAPRESWLKRLMKKLFN
mgnify:CR=1 FL=1